MSYALQHAASVLVWIVGITAGALASAYLLPLHPGWLSDDVAATAVIVSTICIAIQGGLPQVQRTPAVRDAKYLSAMAGAPPDDVVERHGLVVTREGDTLNVSTPEKPLDTL